MGVAKKDGEKKDDKKKKKGKPKKESSAPEGGDGAAEGGEASAPKAKPEKKMSAAAKLAAERLAKQQAAEEAAKAEREAAEAAALAEEEAEKAAEAAAEEERRLKKEKAAAKIAAQKEAGTYKTKAQKEKEKLAAQRIEAMKAAGMITDVPEEAKKKGRVVYDKKKKGGKGKQAAESKPTATTEEVAASAAEPLPTAPAAAEVEDDVGWEDAEIPPVDGGGDAAAAPPAAAGTGAAAEEASWDDVADDWESGDVVVPTIVVPPAGGEEEDAALAEARAEEEKLAESARRRAEREAESAKADAAKAKLREEAAQVGKGGKGGAGGGAGGGGGGGAAAEAEVEAAGGGLEAAVRAVDTSKMSKAELEAHEAKLVARARRKEREAANELLRSTENLRCPVVCIMGHVDTGKTKLLDKIRRTNVQDGEAGGITQQIGATYFPGTTLEEKTGKLNRAFKMQLKLPGMLVIDTPGHEAFSNLRNRGSSICDIAILVIDLMHGLEQQTLESIEMLRKKRCPFVVALNKVDRCYGWKEFKDLEFRDSLAQQDKSAQEEFHHRMKGVRTQLMEKGLNAELYWENKELGSTVSLVPTSAITGEGVNDLLHMLARLSQSHLAKKLSYSPNLQCTVLEVKVIDGLGCTVDVILVNGEIDNGATIVVCTTDGPVVTQIRALLTPPPNRELRVKSQYVHHEKLQGAIGIKLSAPGLENAVAGSPVLVLGPDDDVEDLKEEVMSDFATLAKGLATDSEGVLACASTLGALEALLVFLREECKPPIPVASVTIGTIFKKDVMRAALMHDKKKPEYATILSFDVAIDEDAQAYAASNKVTIFTADIIYHLFDKFTRHRTSTMEEEKSKARDVAVFPCLVQILPKMVFNQKDPIICGVEVMDGILKVGTPLCIPKNGFLAVGKVVSIEQNSAKVERVAKGGQCAISIVNEGNPGMTFGRQFTDEHALYSELSRGSIDALKKYFKDEMNDEAWRLVIKLKKVFSII